MKKALDQILGIVSVIICQLSLECINSPAQLAYMFLLSLAPLSNSPFYVKV